MSHQQAHVSKNQYVVDRVLGNGGFGRVYVAYDRQCQRRCTIKDIRITTDIAH